MGSRGVVEIGMGMGGLRGVKIVLVESSSGCLGDRGLSNYLKGVSKSGTHPLAEAYRFPSMPPQKSVGDLFLL